MKIIVLVGYCFCLMHLHLYGETSLEQEEQFKKDIEACWNEHQKMMGDLQTTFKKQESAKKDGSVQKMINSKSLEPKDEVVLDKQESEQDCQEKSVGKLLPEPDSEESVQKEVAAVTVVPEVKVEKSSRCKALQRVQLELESVE